MEFLLLLVDVPRVGDPDTPHRRRSDVGGTRWRDASARSRASGERATGARGCRGRRTRQDAAGPRRPTPARLCGLDARVEGGLPRARPHRACAEPGGAPGCRPVDAGGPRDGGPRVGRLGLGNRQGQRWCSPSISVALHTPALTIFLQASRSSFPSLNCLGSSPTMHRAEW